MIIRINGWYWVRSAAGKNLGGPYKTKKEADARAAKIEKHSANTPKKKSL